MARSYRFFLRNGKNSELLLNSAEHFHLTEDSEPEIFFQLQKVLRIKPGDSIVFIPQAVAPFFEYYFILENIDKKQMALKFVKKVENKNELERSLGLVLCLPNKPEKLELICQKAVEIGVTKIVLTKGDFSQLKHELRVDRLQKIIIEAAEQAERAQVPALVVENTLVNYLKKVHENQNDFPKLMVAMERSDSKTLLDLDIKNEKGLDLLIGPEGGFSDEEKKLIAELKFESFSLGKRILRMETAAIVALGLAAVL